MFGFSFWLLGCSIPSSKSSFPPPNQAASAARRIFISSDPNVGVQVRRGLVSRNLERFVGIFILAVHALTRSQIVAARSMHFALTVVEGPLNARRLIIFRFQRRRSPSAHLVRRNGGTHCSQFHFGCSAVPFSIHHRKCVAVAPLLCLVPQRSYSVRTSAFRFGEAL